MYLSKQQIKVLIKLSKQDVFCWTTPGKKEFEYLQSLELIKIDRFDKNLAYLTAKGRAVIYDYFRRKKEFWIPVIFSSILSIIAIIISIFSLLS